MMKRVVLWLVGSVLLLSSCGTYEGQGAYVGGTFGAVLGSAIGGLSGGPRGSDLGTIVGMASGAAIGAAIGRSADQKQEERISEYRRYRVSRQTAQRQQGQSRRNDESGFDPTNSGNDIIDFQP